LIEAQEPIDPIDAFARIGQTKVSEANIDGVLNELADVARRAIPGAADVSVTLSRGDGAYTAASAGDLALGLDRRQYDAGHGPCLDALASGEIVMMPDTSSEQRWPDFVAAALQTGCRSSLSVGLPVHEFAAGSLNIYALTAGAFDGDAIVIAQTFAGYAAVALANAHLNNTRTALAQYAQAAMDGRAVIEQAKGMIMGERGCTSEDAFKILTKASQDSNRSLRDVAQALVARAADPTR
jgi:GAF domain-containing protein